MLLSHDPFPHRSVLKKDLQNIAAIRINLVWTEAELGSIGLSLRLRCKKCWLAERLMDIIEGNALCIDVYGDIRLRPSVNGMAFLYSLVSLDSLHLENAHFQIVDALAILLSGNRRKIAVCVELT